MSAFEPKKIKIKAIRDHVIVADMDFGEQKTSSGIILKSDDGKVHGIKSRWGKYMLWAPNKRMLK